MIFSQSLGVASTLTVLFNLNSRGMFENDARRTSDFNLTLCVTDTAVEPGQLFGGTTDGWPSGPAGEVVPIGPGNAGQRNGTQSVVRDDGNRVQMIGSDLGSNLMRASDTEQKPEGSNVGSNTSTEVEVESRGVLSAQ